MSGNGYSIQLRSSMQTGARLCAGIEGFLVLRGQVELLVEGESHLLQDDDLMVVNRGQVHAVHSGEGSLVLTLSVGEEKLLEECGPLADNFIDCGSPARQDAAREKTYFELKRLMVEMFAVKIERPYGYRLAMSTGLLYFLYLLYVTFSHPREDALPAASRKPQMADILAYMDKNYAEPLPLGETAARFYMSTAYFSRYFKKATGEGYLHYLQNLRVEKSLPLLLHGSASILEIALGCGFKNARSYATCFQERYGQPPSAYRKKHPRDAAGQEHVEVLLPEETAEDMRIEFLRYMGRYDVHSPAKAAQEIAADIRVGDAAKGAIRQTEVILLIDTPGVALRTNFQAVAPLRRRINAQYAYFQLLDYRTARQGVSPICWSEMLDAVEILEDYGLYPFIRVDFSPEDFTGPDEEIVAYVRTAVHEMLEAAWVRFPGEYRRHWKFELVCSHFTPAQGRLFYKEAYRVIRGLFPHSAIGLFAQTVDDRGVVPEFEALLKESERQAIPPQFVTFHSFQNRIKKRHPQNTKFYAGEDADYHVNTARAVKAACRAAGLDLPAYMTVWNTLSGENDSEISMYMRTAVILDAMLRTGDEVQGMGFRVPVSGVCPYSGEPGGAPLNLFVIPDGKRPVYFVVEFFKRMAGRVLYRSDHVCAVVNEEQELVVALWNPWLISPASVIDRNLTASLAVKIQVKIAGLGNARYTVKRFTVDSDRNGVFSLVTQSGYPDWRDRDSSRYMKSPSSSGLLVMKEDAADGALTLSSTVQYNGIVMYVIKL